MIDGLRITPPLVGAGLLVLAACQSSTPGRGSDTAAGDVAAGAGGEQRSRISAVRLERQPCFGTCPVYVVDVDSAGRVRFEGRAHVQAMGTVTADISRDDFRGMAERLVQSGVLSFDSTYVSGAPGCGAYATDLPIVTLSVVVDGTTKRIVHDYGCSGAPTALRGLHSMVDSVANTSRWVGS
jgi:hypothetical protein